MGKVIGCIIARTVSKRLPLKILRSIGDHFSMIDMLIQRLKSIKCIDEIYICTSDDAVDDILEDVAARNCIKIYRGSPDNVLERLLTVSEIENAEIVLRITGDNPFTAVEFIDSQVKFLRGRSLDYVRLVDVPIGATAEVIRYEALKRCSQTMDQSVSEYLMLFLFDPSNYRCGVIKPFRKNWALTTLTVDTPSDLERSRQIAKYWNGPIHRITLADILSMVDSNDISHFKIMPLGQVKLPYGQSITFEEFSRDMKERASRSEVLYLYE